MSNKHTDQSVNRRGMARVLTFFLFESLGTQKLFSLVDRTWPDCLNMQADLGSFLLYFPKYHMVPLQATSYKRICIDAIICRLKKT